MKDCIARQSIFCGTVVEVAGNCYLIMIVRHYCLTLPGSVLIGGSLGFALALLPSVGAKILTIGLLMWMLLSELRHASDRTNAQIRIN